MHDLEEQNRNGARKRNFSDMEPSFASDFSDFKQPMDKGFIPRRFLYIYILFDQFHYILNPYYYFFGLNIGAL